MVDKIVKEIDDALENGLFLAALALSLTLPDICGKAEYPTFGNGDRYKNWFDENVSTAKLWKEHEPNAYNEGMPYINGEIAYSLRCCYLHLGNPNIEKSKIKTGDCKIDNFILIIHENNWGLHGTISEATLDENMQITSRG